MFPAIEDALEALINELDLYAPVTIGAMPPKNGICLQVVGGGTNETFFDMARQYNINVVVNARHDDLLQAETALSKIHYELPRRKVFPSGDEWEILFINSASAPNYIERSDTSDFLCGSSLLVELYIKGGIC